MKGYKRYDKNTFCLPRQDMRWVGKRLKIREKLEVGKEFHLDFTYLYFANKVWEKISMGYGKGTDKRK